MRYDLIEYNKCKIHPKYQAKRKPRCLCENCWYLWIISKYGLEYLDFKK